jgi:sugar phosphate isomerase/epimerase
MNRNMKNKVPMSLHPIILLLFAVVVSNAQPASHVFSKDNLTAWCIVPFDANQRTPAERAAMLKELGFQSMAYDWRNENIPQFDQEVTELNQQGIKMTAFWWPGGLPASEELFNSSEQMKLQIDFLKRNDLHIDVWVILNDRGLQNETDEVKFDELAHRTEIFSRKMQEIGCRVGLYNHGGWGGQPGNMVEIIKRVKADNVGLVYNFHHGHDHLTMMPDALNMMLPYLYCINLNGMNPEGPQILPLGQGTTDRKIIKMIAESGYSGPIGIIGHVMEEDVEVVLKRNLKGLQEILEELEYHKALEKY